MAREIEALVHEIAVATREPDAEWLPVSASGGFSPGFWRLNRASLTGGWAGIALLHGYLHRHAGDDTHRATAKFLLDRAMEVISDTPASAGLSSGFVGVAWAAQHLQGVVGGSEDEDPVAEADEVLEVLLSRPERIDEYDLISGLVGWGIYFTERLPRPRARKCLERIVDSLVALADSRENRLCWFTSAERLPPHQREIAPEGYFNLGMAHGAAGVVAMLGAARAAGFTDERIPGLVKSISDWLFEQQRPSDPNERFACWTASGGQGPTGRFAWCYGDPGVIVALYGAALGVENDSLRATALELALWASDLSHPHPDVIDAGLCHGSAGVAHIFNRLYQATGEEQLANAARYWFGRTLELRTPGVGIAGYRSFGSRFDAPRQWVDDGSFLTGVSGTALALLASISNVEPLWDRVLLTTLHASALAGE
jgi:lantibiotic modifying enzyme